MADASQRALPPSGILGTLGTLGTSGNPIDAGGIFLVLITIAVFLLPIFALFPPLPPSPSDAAAQTHTKLGLPRSRSNLKNLNPAVKETKDGEGKIQSLWIYPIKSCRGIEVSRARVIPQGLQFDRLFTFAQLKSSFPASSTQATQGMEEKKDEHAWHFITQRQFPLLATVTVDLWVPDEGKKAPSVEWTDRKDLSDVFLIVRFPWREAGFMGSLAWLAAKLRGGLSAQPEKEILLPVAVPSKEEMDSRGYVYDQVTIWKDTIEAIDMSAELPRELQLYLGVSNKLALFRVDSARLREVMRCAPRKDVAGYQPVTGFQDAYPLHMINLTSLRDFEGKVGLDKDLTELDVRRFRANVIIDEVDAYDEETWKIISFKSKDQDGQRSEFDVSCRTVR
jgi:uncharacterized protein YcbX